MYERIADAPFGATVTLEGDPEVEDADADPPALSGNANGSSSGSDSPTSSETSPHPPEQLWNFRVGRFGVAPAEVGDLTPSQLLECVEAFRALYEAAE